MRFQTYIYTEAKCPNKTFRESDRPTLVRCCRAGRSRCKIINATSRIVAPHTDPEEIQVLEQRENRWDRSAEHGACFSALIMTADSRPARLSQDKTMATPETLWKSTMPGALNHRLRAGIGTCSTAKSIGETSAWITKGERRRCLHCLEICPYYSLDTVVVAAG